MFSLLAVVVIAKIAGYDLGYAAGLYSGSQTISAAMGLSTDAINRLGLPADQAKAVIDSMPVAYAVTYMFGTMGSAIVIAVLVRSCSASNLEAALRLRENSGAPRNSAGGDAWRRWEGGRSAGQGGKPLACRSAKPRPVPDSRVFFQRFAATGRSKRRRRTRFCVKGDVVAVAGAREVLVSLLGANATEVEDTSAWPYRSRAWTSTCNRPSMA